MNSESPTTKEQTNPFENKTTSSSYSKADPIYQKSAEAIVEFQDPLEFGADSVLVDLGAGTGVSSEVLVKKGAKNLTVVDPSKAMLAEAEARLEDEVEYLCSDAEQFYANFEANVDIVYALNCIHLFPDMVKALAGIACALKKGGLFVFNISAPTYSFETIDTEEKALIQANLDFYKNLSEVVENPILAHTVELLKRTIDGDKELLYTKERFVEIFKSVNFEFIDSREIVIEVEADYQKNIWRMIAQSFIQDMEQIETLIKSVELRGMIKLRQAQFKFANQNTLV